MFIAALTLLAAGNPVVEWFVGIVACAGAFFLLRGHFTAAARERRRREKSHGRVVSRKHGPTVRLAVDVDKPKSDRKH